MHNGRLRALDPAAPPAAALDSAHPGHLLRSGGGGAAEGVATFTEVDPSSPDAVWGTLRRHELDVRVAGADPRRAFGAVLDSWLADVAAAATPGDTDSSARVSVASRDTALVNDLLVRGFAPVGVQAIRHPPRHRAPRPGTPEDGLQGARMRVATMQDADDLGRLDAELLRLEAQYGGVTVRPGCGDTFADAYRQRLVVAPDTTWVLERGGRITGFIHVMPHDHSPEPDAPAFAENGGADLVVMYLDASERGAGVGAAFATAVHAALDAAHTPFVFLSYAVANPRSGPFWARMGYRPLFTQWQRRPAQLPAL